MLGERLQELRKDHGLSQQDLADKLNVSIHTISSYERNRSAPDDTMKMEIAKLFDISLDYLLGLVDEPYSFHRAENCMLLPAEFEDAEKKELREYIAFQLFYRLLQDLLLPLVTQNRYETAILRPQHIARRPDIEAFCFPYFELPITFQFCFK